MTALELVKAIEDRGGNLAMNGDKIRCDVPHSAAGLLEDVRAQRDAVIEVLRHRDACGLPWSTYNGGKQFCCVHCSTRFDTSAGLAWHGVNSCRDVPRTAARLTLPPSCPTCGSYALYRLPGGGTECQTCGGDL